MAGGLGRPAPLRCLTAHDGSDGKPAPPPAEHLRGHWRREHGRVAVRASRLALTCSDERSTWASTSIGTENRHTTASALLHSLAPELVGYRTALQETAATRTVNTHLCALRVGCARLTERGVLVATPGARLRLIRRRAPDVPERA